MTTRETLLQKATELFATEGYNGVSVRKLAKAAGITEGSIYNHFASKNDILNDILDNHKKELERNMPTADRLIKAYDQPNWKPAWSYRIRLLEAQTATDMNLEIIQLLTSEQYRNSKAGELVMDYYIDRPIQLTADLFRYLAERGEELPRNPDELAQMYQYPLFGLTQEYTILMSLNKDTTPVINKMKAHVRYFWTEIMKKSFEF